MAVTPKKSTARDALPKTEVLRFLYDYGYFGAKTWTQAKKISGKALQDALRAYQKFNGLKPAGNVDEATAHKMHRRRCGLPDFNMSAKGEVCKWPMSEITYFHEITLPGCTPEQAAHAFDIAFAQWAQVCNITPTRVEAQNKANIYARSGVGKKYHLDGAGGTLAWSELPCGVQENIQLDQMYDEAEDWSFNMAVAVMCHELGHALGLPHLSWGNLMAPYYDPNVTEPQAGDIEEIVKLYGKRKTPYVALKDAPLQVHGTLLINGSPYVLVPQT